nr:MAG TPA: hypothetical protein [Caudoviricetes sp.]
MQNTIDGFFHSIYVIDNVQAVSLSREILNSCNS